MRSTWGIPRGLNKLRLSMETEVSVVAYDKSAQKPRLELKTQRNTTSVDDRACLCSIHYFSLRVYA